MKKIRTAYGISEYRLENGLRFLFKRVTAAPVAAVCVTFHVGSRNEAPGHTGSTHILEHLLFKDTEHFNRHNGKAITDYLEWFGAYINATTWLDRTNYFELVPSDKIAEALELEADRMRNSLFSETDLQSEMTVVRNEYERSRNNPFELLDEEVMAKAYTTHPYRIPTIGTKEDIEHSTARKLHEFYDVFYWPNNATLTIIGDVPFVEAKKLVLKYFGPIPPSPHPIPAMSTVEPRQKVPRRISLRKPMGVSIVELAYKITEGRHKDYPALYAAAIVLAGGYSGRLERALVDTGLAASVSVAAPALFDPGVMSFTVHVAEGAAPAKVLARLRAEVARFAKEGPTQDELVRVQERVRSEASSRRDGALNEARALSESVAAGDWMLDYRVEETIERLRPGDVARVAKKYFIKTGETAGILNNTA